MKQNLKEPGDEPKKDAANGCVLIFAGAMIFGIIYCVGLIAEWWQYAVRNLHIQSGGDANAFTP